MAAPTHLNQLAAYPELQRLAAELQGTAIEQLFADDPARAENFTLQAAGLHLDYSKHLLHREARTALVALAQQAGMGERIAALLAGEAVNNTEGRPALHSLLRAEQGPGLEDKFDQVSAVRVRMQD